MRKKTNKSKAFTLNLEQSYCKSQLVQGWYRTKQNRLVSLQCNKLTFYFAVSWYRKGNRLIRVAKKDKPFFTSIDPWDYIYAEGWI